MEKTKIVILGGGFAGVRAGLDIAKQKISNIDLTLINNGENHEFHADLYEVAAQFLIEEGSSKQKEIQYQNLLGTVSIPLKEIFSGKDISLIKDKVEHINLVNKFLILSEKGKVEFDFLIIALGSTTNFFGIESLQEKSLVLKTVNDALNVRNSIDEIFHRKRRDEKIRIVVGGGGFTGSELAGEIAGYVKKLAKLHQHEENVVSVEIV